MTSATYKSPALPPLLEPRIPVWISNLFLVLLIAAIFPLSQWLTHLVTLRGYRYLNYRYDILIHIGIAIILAVSLNLINGVTGQFSLGHAGFMALGAYTAGVLLRQYPPHGFWVYPAVTGAMVLAGLVAAVAGLMIGVPSLRLRGDYLAIATLGFGQIIAVILNKTESIGPMLVGGAAGLHDIPIYTNLFWTGGWCILCIVTVWRIVHSAKGKGFVAVREDEIAAASVGVNPTRIKVTAFVIGAFFAGVAGSLDALWVGNLAPKSFTFVRSTEIVVMVVFGGSGSITGSILAAILLTFLPEGLRQLSDWRLVIYALILIGMMLLRPAGLLGNRELWWTRRRVRKKD